MSAVNKRAEVNRLSSLDYQEKEGVGARAAPRMCHYS